MDRLLATRQRVDVAHRSPDIVSRLGSVSSAHTLRKERCLLPIKLSVDPSSPTDRSRGCGEPAVPALFFCIPKHLAPQAFNTIRRDRTHEFPSTMAFRIHKSLAQTRIYSPRVSFIVNEAEVPIFSEGFANTYIWARWIHFAS
jgi:hypothetical protein